MECDLNMTSHLNNCVSNLTSLLSTTPNSNLNVPKGVQKWPEFQVAKDLLLYLLPPVIIMGTLGNILSLIVLLRKPMRSTSICFYLAMLAIADTMVLYLSAFKTWIRTLTGFEVLHISNVSCKVVMFLLLVSLHMSAWLIVVMTIDRFVAVWLPLKAFSLCQPSRTKMISLILLILCVLINIHATWSFHILHSETGKGCQPYEDDHFMEVIYPYIKLISYSLLPFIVVLILNLCIIYRMWQSRHLSRLERCKTFESTRQIKHAQNKVTVMLLCITLIWLILTAPFMLWSLVTPASEDPHTFAKMLLIKSIFFLFMYTNHSINFYVYCITGKRFRKELAKMFSSGRNKHHSVPLTLMKPVKKR